MALWLCRTGKHGEHEQKFLDENRIYLTWDGLNHDLGGLKGRGDIQRILKEIYPDSTRQRRIQNSGQIWAFAQRMKPGDWVAVPSKRKTIHIAEITGDYTYFSSGEDPYYHYRTVKWLETDIPRTNFDQDILYSLGAFTAICQIKRNDSEARVRAMANNDWKSTGIKPDIGEEQGEAEDEPSVEDFDLEQIARDQIARLIYSKYSGHGLEDLVESILKAQGYTTYHSGKGADGGIDILASPGTLGFGEPRICVQVKSQETALERPVLDQLVGTMQHVQAEQGLLVCWGGFKRTVKDEEARLFFRVRLWDQNDLIDQFLANYDKLDEGLQAEIPLKRIWVVASQEEVE